MTGGSGKARGAFDRIGRDRPGLAADAAAFLAAVAPCPAATLRWFPASGADPDPAVNDGFPALHLAIGLEPADRAEVIALLLVTARRWKGAARTTGRRSIARPAPSPRRSTSSRCPSTAVPTESCASAPTICLPRSGPSITSMRSDVTT